MRLLSLSPSGTITSTEFFGTDIPRYAVLSHTWGSEGEEVSAGDLIRDDGESKSDLIGYKKILFCGKQAKRHGIDHFWVDTCCIDKSSSAELSEAINSMFRWYSMAAKCFVYLSDVSLHNYEETFSKSRWFARGWTLQELIASKEAEFFSSEMEWLGTKSSLERQIHQTTGIAITALQGGPMSQFSVKERFSWAAHRETKREEDIAYCLLGIFDVSMPLIYGEGKKKALRRLHSLVDVRSEGASYSNIQRWLSPADIRDDLLQHANECMDGSCDWALRTPAVQTFFESKGNDTLRIGGDPGSGKSTLTAFLIQHIIKQTKSNVAYFFCHGTDGNKQRPTQVLRTLVSQMLSQDESLYASFEQPYSHSSRAVVESLAEALDYYQLCLKTTIRQTLYIVVDALDECLEGRQLISCLTQSLGTTSGVVKLILTCRNEPELLNRLPPWHYELLTSRNRTATPILEYVRMRVSENKYISDTALGSEVTRQVVSAASGSWLYARLMMDEIQRLPSAASVRRQLEDIPNGLKQVYLQIFSNMERSMSPLELRLAQQIFLWVDLNDFVDVGKEVLDHEVLDMVLQAEMQGEKVFDPLTLAQQLCSPLVTLTESLFGSIAIKFFHHTAAQFLRDCSEQQASKLPMILKPQTLKGLHRGSVSIWYFKSSPNAAHLLQRLRSRPKSYEEFCEYFEMAYGLWAAFFFITPTDTYGPDELGEMATLIERFSDFITSGAAFVWIEMAIIINYNGGYYKLMDNVMEAINAAEIGATSSVSVIRDFSALRKQFFEDYAYVIYTTGPCDRSIDEPNGFGERPLAVRLMSLGRKWKYLYDESQGDRWTR